MENQKIVHVIYYKSSDEISQHVLSVLLKYQELANLIKYISMDNVILNKNRERYVQLQNGNMILIPSAVQSVPTLLIIDRQTNLVKPYTSNDILTYFGGYIKYIRNAATQGNGEETRYNEDALSGNSINYEYLDGNPNDAAFEQNALDKLYTGRGLLNQPLVSIKEKYVEGPRKKGTLEYNNNEFPIQPTNYVGGGGTFPQPQITEQGKLSEEAMMQQMQKYQSQYGGGGNNFFQAPPNGEMPVPEQLKPIIVDKKVDDTYMQSQIEKYKNSRMSEDNNFKQYMQQYGNGQMY